MPSFTRPITRLVLGISLLVGVVVFAVANGPNLTPLLGAAGAISPTPALLGAALSGAAIANRGGLSRAAHNAAGLPAAPLTMIRPAAAGYAANKLVRSGGLSGTAVLVRHGATRDWARGAVVAACALAASASLAALGLLMAVTLVLLALTGSLGGWWILAGVGFALYVAATLGALTLAARRHPLARRLWLSLANAPARLTRRPLTATTRPLDELAAALRRARRTPRWAGRLLGHALASKVLGASMVLCAGTAAGVPIDPVGAVVVYSTVLAASTASLVPGGIGAVEASMGALLLSAGATVAGAGLAVALFRVFDLWLPVVVGALAARRPTRGVEGSEPAAAAEPSDAELVAA